MSLSFSSLFPKPFRVALAVLAAVAIWTDCRAASPFAVIAYHDITPKVVNQEDITPSEFMRQLDFFKSAGYSPVSIGQIEAAAHGGTPLPDKAILLTFDDAYLSFYRVVYPALKLFDFPAVLSVVTAWADRRSSPDTYYGAKDFMTWGQIKEVGSTGLVTVASHSDNLHNLVRSNPPGNIEPAMTTFVFDEKKAAYETEEEYRARLRADFSATTERFKEKLGARPVVFTWPYGAYSKISLDEAKRAGYRTFLTLKEGFASTDDLETVNRYYAQSMLYWVPGFKEEIRLGLLDTTPVRAVQIDLDRIMVPGSYEASNDNLGKCLDRLTRLGVNTAIVQAFSDREAKGSTRSLYYQNSVLPVEMDFLSHAINRIKARGMVAYVEMPALGFELPDGKANQDLWVRDSPDGPSSSRRFSPFEPRSLDASRRIFRDLSAYVDFDGIVFTDDGYLNDKGDFHPLAAAAFKKALGQELTPAALKEARAQQAWAGLKAETLERYIGELADTVRTYRPTARIVRNIRDTAGGADRVQWSNKSLKGFFRDYDYTLISFSPQSEKRSDRTKARKRMDDLYQLVDALQGKNKTIVSVPAFDREKNQWVKESDLKEDILHLLSTGVVHVAYYPDGAIEDKPRQKEIGSVISGQEFLTDRKGRK